MKTQYNQIYICSPWKQRPNKNNALPLSKQNMHNKLFKQDWSYFSKEISVRQKAFITFLVLYQWDFCCITADRDFTLGLYFVTFRDIHELLVSSIRLLLLRDLIKFITENKDSQAYVDENMESNAVAKFFKHEKFSGMTFQARNSSISALHSSTEFWAPVAAWARPVGEYGVRLIRLCL